MPPCNIHGTAVLLGDRGVLVTGPSGAGKTALALALVSRFSAQGLFCRLVGDDQIFVAGHGARLVCRAPGTIAGLAEVYGIGPQKLAFEPAAVIDLVVRLVPAARMHRFQEDATETIAGCVVVAGSVGYWLCTRKRGVAATSFESTEIPRRGERTIDKGR